MEQTGKKLNILMATMQMGFGGAETHIYELARALVENGHRVTVASAGGKYADMLEKAGITHVTLPLHSKNPVCVLKSLHGLRRLIAREGFDIVHAHARIPAFICGILQKKMRFRFVTTAHWVFQVTPLWKRIADWGERQMAVSEDIKQYLIDNYRQYPDNIFVTVNGIDTNTFSPDAKSTVASSLGMTNTKHRIVSVSRMDESRGRAQLCLARTAKRLLEKYPDLEILIVGDGVISAERNLLSDIRVIAKELEEKYGRKIIFTPGLRTDTAACIACGNIFVGASRAALEAMSCAKPVIVAGNEGYIGIFDASKAEISRKTNFCCRGCPPVDEDKLYSDICTLFGDGSADAQSAYNALCAYSRETVLAEYSAARTARDYEKMYESLPEKTSNRHSDILISGYYGFGNAGDDSIAASIIHGIREQSPAANITVFCKNPRRNAKKYGVRTVGRFNIVSILREMRHAKLFISGGGNLLQNTTSSRSFFYYTAMIRIAKRRGLKIYIYANGVGPLFGTRYERSVVRTLALCDRATFREPQSIDYVASLGADMSKIFLTADPALSISPAPDGRVDYIMRGVEGNAFFAVSLRSFSSLRSEEVENTDEETFAKQIAAEADKIAYATGAKPLYLIMQSSRDKNLCKLVNELSSVKGYILSELTASEILGVLSRCSLVIAMRLHLLIYGAAAGKPLVGVSYDKKVESMLKYMGYEPPLRVSSLQSGELAKAAIARYGSDMPCARMEELKRLAAADAAEAAKMAR